MSQMDFTIETGGIRYALHLPCWETDYIQGRLAKESQPYELSMLESMRCFLQKGDLVLDVGANIGNHTFYLASVVGCKVVAFEPNPVLAEPFVKSIDLNSLSDRVTLIQKGVGAVTAKAVFAESKPDNLGAQALSMVDGSESSTASIDVIPLDSLTFEDSVAAIKIDVEGMELDVLKGAIGLLKKDRPGLFIEAQTEQEFVQIQNFLKPLGYRYFDTFNATPTHWFVHESSLGSVEGVNPGTAAVPMIYRLFRSATNLRRQLEEVNVTLKKETDKLEAEQAKQGLLSQILDDVTARYQSIQEAGQKSLMTNSSKVSLEIKGLIETNSKSLLSAIKESSNKSVRDLLIVQNRLYAQLESMGWLRQKLKLSHALPPLRGQAASPDVLLMLHQNIRQSRPRFIVELGAGASTIVIADALRQNGFGQLVSIEHLPSHGSATSQNLKEQHLDAWVDLKVSELEAWTGACMPALVEAGEESANSPGLHDRETLWYDPAVLSGIESVDLLFVDGPVPEDPYTYYPALPSLFKKMSDHAEIWLNGTLRQESKDVCAAWIKEFDLSVEHVALDKGLAILTKTT